MIDILYRDSKEENVIFEEDEHIKITNFGLAKKNIKTTSITKSYIAQFRIYAPNIEE